MPKVFQSRSNLLNLLISCWRHFIFDDEENTCARFSCFDIEPPQHIRVPLLWEYNYFNSSGNVVFGAFGISYRPFTLPRKSLLFKCCYTCMAFQGCHYLRLVMSHEAGVNMMMYNSIIDFIAGRYHQRSNYHQPHWMKFPFGSRLPLFED